MKPSKFAELDQKPTNLIQRPVSVQLRILGLIIFVGLASSYFVTWRSVRKNLTDFVPMYASARLFQANETVYNIAAQCREQSKVRSDLCMPFNHPPLLLPLISLVSTEDYAASYRRWSLILSVLLLFCLIPAYLLSRSVDASLQLILFFPVFLSITQGQDTIFLLFAILCWALLLQMRKDFWAGLVLVLGAVKPHLVLLLGLPLLFSRPRAFLGFVLGGFVAVLFSWYLVGTSGLLGLIQITRLSATGTTFGVHHADMYSAVGIFVRAGASPYWVWPVFVVALVATSVLWRRYSISKQSLALGLIFMIVGAPHLIMHDLAPLGIPLFFIHPLGPIVGSIIILSCLAFDVTLIGVYLILIAAAFYFWQLTKNDRPGNSPHHETAIKHQNHG